MCVYDIKEKQIIQVGEVEKHTTHCINKNSSRKSSIFVYEREKERNLIDLDFQS